MKSFDPSRINVEFRDGVTAIQPVVGRKYTLTHSDETAEIFVTIGSKYAEDKIGPLRDEVLLTLQRKNRQLEFFGTVLVDTLSQSWDASKRSEIFLREMPTALEAIRYVDRDFFEHYPGLDHIPIYIWFKSIQKEYNMLYDFGTMKDYKKF